MATVDIKITSSQGTNTTTLTFSGADSARIFAAYQKLVQAGGTQAQLADYLAQQAQRMFANWILSAEQIVPASPVITSQST